MQQTVFKRYKTFYFTRIVHFVLQLLFKSSNTFIRLGCILGLLCALSCTEKETRNKICRVKSSYITINPSLGDTATTAAERFMKLLRMAGFVNLQTLDSSIRVDLRYSSENNIWQTDWYADFDSAYLPKDVAQRLVAAQGEIKKTRPDVRIVIYDAVRPLSVQQQLWDSAPVSEQERRRLLSNPQQRSLHNYGAAVDVGLIDTNGVELDMGTEFDSPSELAYPWLESYFLQNGSLLNEQYNNRLLLRNAMKRAGFIQNRYEWWHYSACLKKDAIAQYAMVESFSQISSPQFAKDLLSSSQPKDSVGVQFRIQIATSPKLLAFDAIGTNQVSWYRHQNMYKYTLGAFSDLEAAYHLRDQVRTNGYPQAFVVCFWGENRIDIRQAIELSNL